MEPMELLDLLVPQVKIDDLLVQYRLFEKLTYKSHIIINPYEKDLRVRQVRMARMASMVKTAKMEHQALPVHQVLCMSQLINSNAAVV